MAQGLNRYHILKYAGFNLNAIDNEITFYVSTRNGVKKVHGRQACYSGQGGYWSAQNTSKETVKMKPSEVTASSACHDCFSAAFKNVKGWEFYEDLALQIRDKNARLLRQVNLKNSKKNTADAEAKQAAALQEAFKSIPKTIHGAGQEFINELDSFRTKLEERISKMTQQVKKRGILPENAKVLIAGGTIYSSQEDRTVEWNKTIKTLTGSDSWERHGESYNENVMKFIIDSVDQDNNLDTEKLTKALTAMARLRNFNQLSFNVNLEAQSGDMYEIMRSMWSGEVRNQVAVFVKHVEKSFTDKPQNVIVSLQRETYRENRLDESFQKAREEAFEIFSIGQNANFRLLYGPFNILKGLFANSRSVLIAKADDITAEGAEIVGSLYKFTGKEELNAHIEIAKELS